MKEKNAIKVEVKIKPRNKVFLVERVFDKEHRISRLFDEEKEEELKKVEQLRSLLEVVNKTSRPYVKFIVRSIKNDRTKLAEKSILDWVVWNA